MRVLTMIRFYGFKIVLWAALGSSLGCSSSSLPGTALGTFNVTGTLGTNTCGSGLNASNPYDFTVQMSIDGTTLYWETSDGVELSATMSSTTAATITSTQTANADATEAGAGACDLTDVETIAIKLNTATSPSAFTGSLTYSFSAATGISSTNNCTDQLASSGGSYASLPCTATYSLSATKQ